MMPTVLLALALAAPQADRPAVRLAVRPAAAPRPALRYQLLPEVRELTPGNPVQWYLRCFAEQRNFFFGKDGVAQRVRYQKMTLAELASQKLKQFGGSALTQADWGARLDTPDWQVLERVQTEGADLVQPELGALRLLGESLQIRFRAEVAREDYDAAIGTAKTMLALARHLGENPTPAAGEVGLAVANMALDTLEEMIPQPGCPNLYWALTELPGPLVDIRKGFQGHRAQAETELRAIRDDRPMTDAELDEVVGRLTGRAGLARVRAGEPPRNFRATLAARAKDADHLRAARARLADAGPAGSVVAKFPPLQVVLLDEKCEFEALRDEELKLVALAPRELNTPTRERKAAPDVLFADLLPRAADARLAQARLEQRVALLRHVEALRLSAAAHGGGLPAKLAGAGVPLPPDPFTGKPFGYEVKDGVAHLRAAPPGGDAKPSRYEITILRKDEGGRPKDE